MSSVIVVKRGYRRAVIVAGMRGAPGAGSVGSAGVSNFNTRTGPVTLVSADVSGALGYTPANSADLAGVALSGSYADLSGLPAIPAAPGDLGAATAAQGAKADTAVQPGELASVAASGSYADLSAKPFIPALPGDIGAATAAQGAKADTAVQPAALASGLAGKVDKDGTKVLSDQNYTAAEKAKLAGIEGPQFKGLHISLAALQAAHPTAAAGNYADVDSGTGADVARYIWDVSDSAWIIQSGAIGSMTAAQIKTAYESNPDTNVFSDAEQAKLGGIASAATANATDAQLRDRSTHTGTQAASTISDFAATVRATVLTGLSLASGAAIAAGDSALVAWGKLQKQITDLAAAVSGKQETLVSGTNIKTLNGSSLLGTGNLDIAGGGMANPMTTAGDLIVGGSAGVPSRLGLGSSAQVLRVNLAGTGLEYGAAAGGGLTNIAEAKSTAAPNATTPVVSLSVSITETNGDFAFLPKGAGAFSLAVPDSTVTGGNKRGSRAVDLQLSRSNAIHVASGNCSALVGGHGNQAQGAYSAVLGGTACSANGSIATVIGGDACYALGAYTGVYGGSTNTVDASSVYGFIYGGQTNNILSGIHAVILGGKENTVSGSYGSISGGLSATTRGVDGAEARAAGKFTSQGDAQRGRYILRRSTTNAAAAVLSTTGDAAAATNQVVLPNAGTYAFEGRIVARSSAEQATFKITGLITRGANAAATVVVGTPTITAVAASAGASAWTVAASANTTLGCLTLTVTGVAATNIKWVADIETVEVVG